MQLPDVHLSEADFSRLQFYLDIFYEFAHEISSLRGVDNILQRMLRIVTGIGVTKGIALTRQSGELRYQVVAHTHFEPSTLNKISQQLKRDGITDNLSEKRGFVQLPQPTSTPITLGEVLANSEMCATLTLQIEAQLTVVVGFGALLSEGTYATHQVQLLEALGKQTVLALGNAILYEGLARENERLRTALDTRNRFGDITGQSDVMQRVYRQIERAAEYANYSVLITGESGTGKGLVARAIHEQSPRNGEFVTVPTTALPRELVESELFGHEKGAFSGAIQAKPGLFEHATGGTIFLDEIGDMPLESQAKLLVVLQEGKIRRLGAVQDRSVNVRVIAATNKDLEDAVHRGVFREDLFYRFTVKIEVPPLHDRKADIPLLVDVLLDKIATETRKPKKIMSTEGLRLLTNHYWPGNVRELENTLIQLFMTTDATVIRAEDIGMFLEKTLPTAQSGVSLDQIMRQFKSEVIRNTLKHCNGNVSETARQLGISRQNLQGYIRRLKLKRT
jgi:DNA-binding NtrC family response regulator